MSERDETDAISIAEMQAAAQVAMEVRAEAVKLYYAGLPYPSEAEQGEAWANLPNRAAVFGDVECEAMLPDTTVAGRRKHVRYVWRVGGKRTRVEIVEAALHAGRLWLSPGPPPGNKSPPQT